MTGIERLKAQLLLSGLQEKDQPLFQIISQLIDAVRKNSQAIEIGGTGGGGTSSGIIQLTGDVEAGPGLSPQVATIPNGTITYPKMQEVQQTSVLLGNNNISAPAVVKEIHLGPNLIIEDNRIDIINNGVKGLNHRVLSETHIDSLPAVPVFGDLIWAGPGDEIIPTYANAVATSVIEEDFHGVRMSLAVGFGGAALPSSGNVGWGAPPVINYITPAPAPQWLTWNLINAYAQSVIVQDFSGVRGAMITPGFSGTNGWALAAPDIDYIPAPDPEVTTEPRWQRLPIGTDGQILTIVDGVPTWV